MICTILGTAHTEDTLGKRSPDGSLKEYLYSRKLVKAIFNSLKEKGYLVYIDSMETKIPNELKERCRIVNTLCKKYKNCIYISIHVNAAGNGTNWANATGWEAYTSKGFTKADELANCLYKSAIKNLEGQKIRTSGSKYLAKEANFYVLRHTNCPAVLTENFFMDNKKDVEFLLSEKGFNQLVNLHVEGIINYIKDNS